MAGDFGKIAESYAPGAAEFIRRLNLRPSDRVLDVACGTGNLSIPAARSGARVTGIDIAPNLLEQAEEWAKAEGLAITFEEGNAEQLPYADAAFDAVVTMFGVMFAPRADDALPNSCVSAALVGASPWRTGCPMVSSARCSRSWASMCHPRPGVPSPLMWGNEATVAERLGSEIAELRCTPRTITFNFPFDAAATVEYFRTFYGPTLRAFDSLVQRHSKRFAATWKRYWSQHNYGHRWHNEGGFHLLRSRCNS